MMNKYCVIGFVAFLPRLERGMEVNTVEEAYPLCLPAYSATLRMFLLMEQEFRVEKATLNHFISLMENLYKNLHKQGVGTSTVQ